MIQLDEASARALSRFGEEVLNIDARARCSDKYFRQHFVTFAKNPFMRDAFIALKTALDAPCAYDDVENKQPPKEA